MLTGIDGLSFVHLGARDVVRHRIVQDIVEAYEREAGLREAGDSGDGVGTDAGDDDSDGSR
jgi:phosphate starvation-inducible PhoH-like protein